MNKIHIAPDIIPLLEKGSYKVIRQGDSVFIQVNSKKVDFSQDPFSTIENSSIYNKLQNLNITPDLFNYNLVLMAKQLSMKLNPELIKLARNIGLRFPGKEKKAGEIALILKSKGIKPTLELVEQLLSEISTDSDSRDFSENKQDFEAPQNLIFNFLKSLPSNKQKEGTLSILNHLPQTKKSNPDYSWIMLPFSIVSTENTDNIFGEGTIKILLNTRTRAASKIHIETSWKNESFIFHFELSNKIPVKLYWSDGKKSEAKSETERLSSFMNGIPVQWHIYEELENLAQGLDKIETVEAML